MKTGPAFASDPDAEKDQRMTTDVRYPGLIPMVQAVLLTLDEGIVAEETFAADLARRGRAMPDDHGMTAASLLNASRRITVRALEMRGKRAALLAQYGL